MVQKHTETMKAILAILYQQYYVGMLDDLLTSAAIYIK